jgi:hypothetical protein
MPLRASIQRQSAVEKGNVTKKYGKPMTAPRRQIGSTVLRYSRRETDRSQRIQSPLERA